MSAAADTDAPISSRVVVTGSTRGLGRAFAAALAAAGAQVVVNGTDAAVTAATVAELAADGGTVAGLSGSVADPDFCDALIECCVATFGGIDMVINNAGITRDRSVMKMTAPDFDEVIDVHLRGTWACSVAAARAMRRDGGGRILNITSGSGLFGMFGQANYAAAKAGVVGLTRVLDLELARYGIVANALAPVASTDMTKVFDTDTGLEHVLAFPDPASVAPVVVYLAGPAAAGLHGQCLGFDGTDLTVWSHPQILHSWSSASGWTPSQVAHALADEGARDYPHADRWGAGAHATGLVEGRESR